jgi:methionine salvage enolase-phosphatase E1
MITQCIALDLDGTLAWYDGWQGHDHIGRPFSDTVEFVKSLHEAGHEMWIFTAREEDSHDHIWGWLREHGMKEYITGITNVKLPRFTLFLDDRGMNYSGKYPHIDIINEFKQWWKINA